MASKEQKCKDAIEAILTYVNSQPGRQITFMSTFQNGDVVMFLEDHYEHAPTIQRHHHLDGYRGRGVEAMALEITNCLNSRLHEN